MSRNTFILLAVMCAAVAGLIIYSKSRPDPNTVAGINPPENSAVAGGPTTRENPGGTGPNTANGANSLPPNTRPGDITSTTPITTSPGFNPPSGVPGVNPPTVGPDGKGPEFAFTNKVPRPPITPPDEVPVVKPLPVMESEYAATTNRDTRLDIMMEIAETPGAETVRALTRLFELETDSELKVDLIDSLLGIEGHTDEKLVLLTMGARPGLPNDVRLSAVDGLIELEDHRAIPVLNGMLNDPSEDIREAAKDALEMLQSQPAVKLK